jgi:transposase InsO family protein
MQAKREFIQLALSETIPMTPLCHRFGISRQTGYKWLERYRAEGEAGLVERSRRPHASPRQTDPAIERQVAQLRQAHPHWGGAKLRSVLVAHGGTGIPSGRTCTTILQRQGLIDPTQPTPRAWQRFEAEQPNGLVQIDFKGPIPLQSGRGHALSILDDHSRYLLGLRWCADQTEATVKAALTEVFRRYGLPWRVLTDNGPPWGNPNQTQPLTRFSIWLLRLGIAVSHGAPYHPQTQGKVERFHRTLNLEVLGQPLVDRAQAEAVFAAWRTEYNTLRPHRALGEQPPASRYTPSPRPFPEVLPPIAYDDELTVRTVKTSGQIQLSNRLIFVSQALAGERIALRPTRIDGIWQVQFCHQVMGLLDQRDPQGPTVRFGLNDPTEID